MPWKDEELQIRRISSENIRAEGHSQYGYMCDIKAKATTVRLTKISFGRTGSNSGCHVQIFIRMGTYREHVQSESGWRRVCDQTRDMRELQPDTLQHFQLRPPLELQAGQTGAIYIHTSDSSGIAFSSSTYPADSRDLENADVRISTGLYLSGSAPFSSPGNERHFLGTFEYEASAE
eukprot:GAFH01004858.1.p1 GENE.GAFH01004858.1~~GAFH01004858.1.p1  ORF type:complete len:177 (+),score=35.09 GAFH01004858.1:40-570(+)